MVYKVFVDTNVILDIFLKRKPFFENSQKVVLKLVENKFLPHISGSSVTDVYYICKRSGMKRDVILEKLKKLLKAFEVLIIDKDLVNDAISISSEIKDFEDAVQIMACKKGEIDLIITRNKKDFKIDWIQIQNPQEFLTSFAKENLPDPFESDEEKFDQ